jgi:PAS domain S-box-containing protein
MIKGSKGKTEQRCDDPGSLSPDELFSIIQQLQKENRELRRKDTLAELINDASIDRILAINKETKIIAWNKMLESITGISKDESLGRDLFEVLPEMADIPEINRAIKSALKGFKSFVPSDKGSFSGSYCEHHFVPLHDEEGEVFGVLNIIHDVAHRIKVENELRKLNKALVKKNKELKQKNSELVSFAHVTAHDLKEPLRKIYTFLEMILNKDADRLSEEGKVYFRRVQASAQRMGLLTDDILSYTQLNDENNREGSVDLNEVLQDAKQSLMESMTFSQAAIHTAALPAITGFRSLIFQLFKNILHNALKFRNPDATPVVEITSTTASGNDIKHADAVPEVQYCRVSVTDNGIGFDIKYADKIFQIFQRLHPDDQYAGTGMGLAICKKVMEIHQGFITAESSPGKGSTFHCYFPVG